MPHTQMKRKKILYLGLDPTRYVHEGELFHLPIIRIEARPFQEVEKAFRKLSTFTHFLFTSRNAIEIFAAYAQKAGNVFSELKKKIFVVVGKASALKLKEMGVETSFIAKEETGEGVITLLEELNLKAAFVFFPRSSLSRDLILAYLLEKKIPHEAPFLYDTLPSPIKLPSLEDIDEIVFTSPSTVRYFLEISTMPPREKCIALGPVTESYLNKIFMEKCYT